MVQQTKTATTIGVFSGVYGIISPNEFLLLKPRLYEYTPKFNVKLPKSTKHKISFWLCPWQPYRDSPNRSSNKVTAQTGHRIKSQSYVRVRQKRSKGKFQNF